MNAKTGYLIAFCGISGSGKSTCARLVSQITSWKTFLEPEIENWPSILKSNLEPSKIGAFFAFRSMRVPKLFEALHQKNAGDIVIVDSYFDKLTGTYIQDTGMEWLLPEEDPYRNEIIKISEIDYKLLPDADLVIVFKCSFEQWEKRIISRGREIDHQLSTVSYFKIQEKIIDALERWSAESGKAVIKYNQTFGDQYSAAKNVAHIIAVNLQISS